MNLIIYKTNKNNWYFETDETFKKTKSNDVMYTIEGDFPCEVKKTKLDKAPESIADVESMLIELFGGDQYEE